MIRHSVCDICTPGPYCGLELTVEDGKITAVRGTPDFPGSKGKLCVKGLATKEFVERPDRITQPMRRVGPRGSGQFEPISWEQALDEAGRRLLELKEKYGPQSVLFMTGYPKWYRPWLHRLAYSFGSPNYITESSTCNRARIMAHRLLFGREMKPDLGRASVCLGWGYNPATNNHIGWNGLKAFRERGGKLLVVDPRGTETGKRADLVLRPKNGTDMALAFALANLLFESGRADDDFLERYASGVGEYRALVRPYTPEWAQQLTGVSAGDIRAAADLLTSGGPVATFTGNSLTHRRDGLDLTRAVLTLPILLGQVDKPGTLLPAFDTLCHSDAGMDSNEKAFELGTRRDDMAPAVGTARFPLWHDMIPEGQGMDLTRWLETGGDYPLKGAVCFGVNHLMYPESPRFLKAMEGLDFIVAADLFWTETCRRADLVLPALSSVERAEVKCYAGKFLYYVQPAIEPLTDGRDDVAIMAGLARRIAPEDALLCAGYDESIRYIMQPLGITDWEAVKAADGPVAVPVPRKYEPGSYLGAIPTPSGKLELASPAAGRYAQFGLSALPVWHPPVEDPKYPFTLMAGARLPFALHTRCHKVPRLRRLRPEPLADIHPEDAAALGITQGDQVELSTTVGAIVMTANVTDQVNRGEVSIYHDYEEANANDLIPIDHLDPYSGFPGYKQVSCAVKKV